MRPITASTAMIGLVLLGATVSHAQWTWSAASLHPEGAQVSRAYGVDGEREVGAAGPMLHLYYTGEAGAWTGSAESWVKFPGSWQGVPQDVHGDQVVGTYMFLNVDPEAFKTQGLRK